MVVANPAVCLLLFRANRLLVRAKLLDAGTVATPARYGSFLRLTFVTKALAWPRSRLAPNSKTRDAGCAIGSGRKETPMTEIDSAFVEAEIAEHHAALVRQIVAVGVIMCLLLIWVGLHH
jgi:hypothetical protein